MRSTVLLEILREVDTLDASDADAMKQKVKQLVRTKGIEHGVKAIEKTERVDFARRLLNARVSRTTIMERLKARFDISKEQAYREVRSALQLCQKSKPIDTSEAHTKASDGVSPQLADDERN